MGLNTPSLIDIDLIISSLGSVNHELLCALYYAAQGDDGQKVLRERTSKTKAKKADAKHELTSATLEDHFRIYFPSHDTVAHSRGGPRVRRSLVIASFACILCCINDPLEFSWLGLSARSPSGGIPILSPENSFTITTMSAVVFYSIAR